MSNNVSLQQQNKVTFREEQIDLVWNNLSVQLINQTNARGSKVTDELSTPLTSLSEQNNTRYLLQNQTGYARRGQMTAILGPSGAGKTTMLACLSQRLGNHKTSRIEGRISANGIPYDLNDFCKFGVFVMQNDVLLAALTVKESLNFSANLRLSCTQHEKNEKVAQLLHDLQLTHCQHTYIGNNILKGVSGGERKRTSIGVELISNASVIILDEPTSGLDSFTAFIVMSILRGIAKSQNKTVLFTIHQPSSDILELIDRIIILNEGKTVYQGNVDQIQHYLLHMGIKVPKFSNPCDIFLYNLQQSNSLTSMAYKQYLSKEVETEVEDIPNVLVLPRSQVNNSFFYEFKTLARRHILNYYRLPGLLRARLLVTIILTAFPSAIYWQTYNNNRPDSFPIPSTTPQITKYVQNLAAALFFLGIIAIFSAMGPLIQLFPIEREVYLKEVSSKQYRVTSYFLAKVLVEIPFALMTPLISSSIVYFALAFHQTIWSYFTFVSAQILIALAGNGMGIFTGSLFPDTRRSVAMAPLVFMPFLVFGGELSNLSTLSKWVSWFQYLSPIRYYQEIALSSQFQDVQFLSEPGSFIVDPLHELGMDLGILTCYTMIVTIAVVFHLLAFIFLKFLSLKISV